MRLRLPTAVLLFALAGAVGAAPPAGDDSVPKIVSLNPSAKPDVPPAPPNPPPTDGPLKLSPGNIQVLRLENHKGSPVLWDVILPLDGKDQPKQLVEWTPMAANAPLFGFMEGDKFAKRHAFNTETLVLVATGKGEGTVRVRAQVIEDGRIKTIASAFVKVSGAGPPIPPDPDPNPPVPPTPPGPSPDAAMVTKFKNALTSDIAANQGTKEKAAALAVVFESGASLLDIGDPAIAPRTVGDLTQKMINASVAKGIPRLPYLKNVRAVVEAHTPMLNGLTELTPAIKAEFQTKYRAVAAALAEASK